MAAPGVGEPRRPSEQETGERLRVGMHATQNDISLDFRPAAEALGDADFRADWEALLHGEAGLNRLYSAPTWIEHLVHTNPEAESLLGVVRDEGRRLIGVCPLRVQRLPLLFDVWNRVLAKSMLGAVCLPVGEPLFPRTPEVYRRFFQGVFQAVGRCDCVYLPVLPTDSYAWRFFQEEGGQSRDYFVYLPDGVRPWHRLELHGDFESSLRTMDKKGRYNLRRQVRELRDHGGGSLECTCIVSEDQVGDFLQAAAVVSEKTWQRRVLGPRVVNTEQRTKLLKDLASRKLLRAYLLQCGGRPCAFAIGYQFEQVFHYEEIGFDESLARFSPGTVLLYLLIEDLCNHSSLSVLNFGIGDAMYKRRFGNRTGEDAAVILFRKSIRNRLRQVCHSSFRSAVHLAKKMLRRKVKKEG